MNSINLSSCYQPEQTLCRKKCSLPRLSLKGVLAHLDWTMPTCLSAVETTHRRMVQAQSNR